MLRAKSKASDSGQNDPRLFWWAPDDKGKPIQLLRDRHRKSIREHFFGNCRVERIQIRFAAWELANRFVAAYIRWAQASEDPGTPPGMVQANDLNLKQGGAPPDLDGPEEAQAAPARRPEAPRGNARYAGPPPAETAGERRSTFPRRRTSRTTSRFENVRSVKGSNMGDLAWLATTQNNDVVGLGASVEEAFEDARNRGANVVPKWRLKYLAVQNNEIVALRDTIMMGGDGKRIEYD